MIPQRRTPFVGWYRLVCALTALLATPASAAPATDEAADLVLRGGRVVTLDPGRPEARALAIRGHLIVAVGSDAAVDALVGPATRVIDLDGRLVLPGFIEGHGHFLDLGRTRMELDLTRARRWDDIVRMAAAAAAELPRGAWVVGHGWHQEKWEDLPEPSVDGVPLNDGLSAATPDHPVILEHASGHAWYANDRALALAGIGRDTLDPPGGTIVRDASGGATGLLRENADALVRSVYTQSLAELGAEGRSALFRRAVELAGREALAKGITSFHDAGVSFDEIDGYKALAARGALPVRLYAMLRAVPEILEARLADYRILPRGNDHLAVRALKRQIDGALGSHGAWLLEPYADMPETSGLVVESVETVARTARLALRHGFQLATHAIGDRANREVLDIYAAAFAGRDDAGELRWRIEHAQHLHPDDVPRFAQLGVIAAMQGVHCTSDGPWVEKRLGTERARSGAYVWRALLDAGALVTNGTDAPVEDVDPIAGFYSSVTRRSADGSTFHPDQAMTRAQALRSYTIDNARAAFEEHLKGSLEVGKLGDVVVLSRDILRVSEAEIPATRVDFTIVGGDVRFERR